MRCNRVRAALVLVVLQIRNGVPRMERMGNIADNLRKAIEGSSVSRNALASAAGVPASLLSRFMSGKGTISLDAADAIATVLGMRLVEASGKPYPPLASVDAMPPVSRPQPDRTDGKWICRSKQHARDTYTNYGPVCERCGEARP